MREAGETGVEIVIGIAKYVSPTLSVEIPIAQDVRAGESASEEPENRRTS